MTFKILYKFFNLGHLLNLIKDNVTFGFSLFLSLSLHLHLHIRNIISASQHQHNEHAVVAPFYQLFKNVSGLIGFLWMEYTMLLIWTWMLYGYEKVSNERMSYHN